MAHSMLRYAVRSDPGRRREHNEDAAYAGPNLLALADGMGGHVHGEIASTIAIEVVTGLSDLPPGANLPEALGGAVFEAGVRLHAAAFEDPQLEGMGTTLTAMLWDGHRFALAHVGDSRGLLLRDGRLYQITRDHTLVQALLDEGRITEEQAAVHPRRSLVTRALDSATEPEPDIEERTALPGDRYLLCSDGLTDVVGPQAIHEAMTAHPIPGEAAQALVDLANDQGGPDNITCVVADVTAAPEPAPPPVLAGAAYGLRPAL